MTWEQAEVALFAFAILCEQAHVASPIVLAWSHPGLRQIALSRPIETMLLPVIAMTGALLVPLPVIFAVYSVWNVYHFGSQNYGVMRLLRLRVTRWWPIGITVLMMLPLLERGPHALYPAMPDLIPDFPYRQGWYFWLLVGLIDFPHWLVDIGLSSRVSRYWWAFILTLIPFGLIGFAWKTPIPAGIATLMIPWVLQARWGIGIVHFLYSRWEWKLSDPRVRAAIGKDLFATP